MSAITAIRFTPARHFPTFVANKTTCSIRRLGDPCVALGWPLRGPWVAQGWPKPKPNRQRVARRKPLRLLLIFLAKSQEPIAKSRIVKYRDRSHPWGLLHPTAVLHNIHARTCTPSADMSFATHCLNPGHVRVSNDQCQTPGVRAATLERASFLINPSPCFPEQARATNGSKGASKDPENTSPAMLMQGVLFQAAG